LVEKKKAPVSRFLGKGVRPNYMRMFSNKKD